MSIPFRVFRGSHQIFIHSGLLRLVFDTAALRGCGVERSNNLAARPKSARSGDRYVFSAMVGMARCAVPARVVAGGMAIRETMAIEGVAPLHAARTSQRDVPAALKTYSPEGEGSG